MGKRGPKPQPTKLRLITGQTGGGRPLNRSEPEPALSRGMPQPPDWLEKFAKDRWLVLVEQLYLTGMLTEVDLGTFAVYCECWGQYRRAIDDMKGFARRDRKTKTHGILAAASTGTYIINPLVSQLNTLRKQLQTLGAELGLSPSSRSNIDVGKAGNDDPVAGKYNLA